MTSLSDLRVFCKYIVKKYGSPDLLSEEDKAEEFRSIYLKNLSPNLRTLKAVAATCGISLSGLDKLPDNVRGYHDVFEGKRKIYFRKNDTVSGIENTILHEFREMIEPVFGELCPGYEPLRTTAVHLAANRFASAVLLPRDRFIKRIYESGLDIVTLADSYRKSCSQVLLRTGEVLAGTLYFYGALYERDNNADQQWKVTYWTESRNEDTPEANVSNLTNFFPRKGHQVVPGSLVDMTVKTGKPHHVKHITIIDGIDDGLTAITQPLLLAESRGSKVVLLVLLEADTHSLKPQIRRTRPVAIDSFYKHL